uniref:disease resistance protein Roq1-like n=1 Tax=Erigeron canadensis TaxID=72917 RepID=UPI001CB99482|nr:disease resistance protein Roq1-like [Erigeron canadensis]
MEYRLEQLKLQLKIGLGGVRMVGIWGLGGGGKTTLATTFYKKFSLNYDGCCFLENIWEETQNHGLKRLQAKILSTIFGKKMQVGSVELGKDKIKQMLCNRKVLIILDDVDHLDQLKAFAGCRKWFGDGSRLIITTRDQHLLTFIDETEVSPLSLLSHEEAVSLFNKRAYNAKTLYKIMKCFCWKD